MGKTEDASADKKPTIKIPLADYRVPEYRFAGQEDIERMEQALSKVANSYETLLSSTQKKLIETGKRMDKLQHVQLDALSSIGKRVEDWMATLGRALAEYKPVWDELDDFFKQYDKVKVEDDKIAKYNDNPLFWDNIKAVSRELVIIPFSVSEDVLDYLGKERINPDEVRRLIGEPDLEEFALELNDEEHDDYLFKGYLLDILALHKRDPDMFRISIPALFAIIEGTLAEIFKISEGGMAKEIKQKMTLVWDLYHFVYVREIMGKHITFSNKVTLVNLREIFKQLTVNSKDAGIHINRNAILHGRSNPDDWKLEDFVLLMNIMQTILFTRQTVDILLHEFKGMVFDDFYIEQKGEGDNQKEDEEFRLDEFQDGIALKNKNGADRAYSRKEVNQLRKELKTDLCHLLSETEERVESILNLSNFVEIEKTLLTPK